jgi:environmental stress-induced protein Ves
MKKTTKDTLSSLDWAIAQTYEEPRQPDEFTAREFSEKAGVTIDIAQKRLAKMPGIERRLVTLNGTRMLLHRKA